MMASLALLVRAWQSYNNTLPHNTDDMCLQSSRIYDGKFSIAGESLAGGGGVSPAGRAGGHVVTRVCGGVARPSIGDTQ